MMSRQASSLKPLRCMEPLNERHRQQPMVLGFARVGDPSKARTLRCYIIKTASRQRPASSDLARPLAESDTLFDVRATGLISCVWRRAIGAEVAYRIGVKNAAAEPTQQMRKC